MYLSQRVIITCRDAISVIGLATNRGRMAFDGGGESATPSGSLIHNGIFLSQAAIYQIKSAVILAEVDGVCQTKMSQVNSQGILTHKSKAVVTLPLPQFKHLTLPSLSLPTTLSLLGASTNGLK
jgi:hypothetical protein